MSFWVAMIDRRREELAINCLKLAEYDVYSPHVREARNGHHRVVPLFPSYVFLAVAERGWWAARWSPGVIRLVLSGHEKPATVPDQIVAELRGREDRNGLVRLPKPSRLNGAAQFAPGDAVRVKSGPMSGLSGLVQGMKPHARVELLLQMLGSLQRVELAAASVERLA
jgi:transcription antitermination factor NusG